MIFFGRGFNLYLLPLLALALATGCQTSRADKKLSTLRVHIESSANIAEGGQTVSVLRNEPVAIMISTLPVVSEANVVAATLLEVPGGYAVRVRFDETATIMLEQYTATSPGKHLVIAGQWGEKIDESRWLAAPLITHRIADGSLTFTPDASRDEAKQWVLGLNNVAKKNAKGALK